MSDDTTRRSFIKWIGLGAGSAAIGGLAGACADNGGTNTPPTDSGTTGDTTDTSPGPDTSPPNDASSDASSDGGQCDATGDDVEGPFHVEGAPQRADLAPDDEPGDPIIIQGTVYESDCTTPIEGALLDVWHANDDGDYYDASEDYRLRGQLQTDADGTYEIRTIRPGRYPDAGGLRPRHVHFIISSPPHGSLTTQMYFADDSQLQDDSCGICASDDPTLIVDFSTEQRNGSDILVGTFDIVLSG